MISFWDFVIGSLEDMYLGILINIIYKEKLILDIVLY